jgi:hypothetical protein
MAASQPILPIHLTAAAAADLATKLWKREILFLKPGSVFTKFQSLCNLQMGIVS